MSDFRNLVSSKAGLTFIALVITLGLGILIGTIVTDGVSGSQQTLAKVDQLRIQGEGEPLVLDREIDLYEGFSAVARTVGPAVVNISTQTIISRSEPQRRQRPEQDPFRDFFGQDFWDRLFGPQGSPRDRKATSLGSGVIVDSKGFILTNYHVIAPVRSRAGVQRLADKIEVRLSNGDSYIAHLVGEDQDSDLAVLRIDSSKALPFAKIGDAAKLRPGDWVLAIGSPFGLEHTVTSGIVSATQRVFDPSERGGIGSLFGDYIQTDASINPGNSGGPLVNMRGEVVGINSFISTPTGASAGVGFAIPSTVFVNAYNQLVEKGRIERGFLGVAMNVYPMTEEMAKFFGVPNDSPESQMEGRGVLVTQLINESGDPSESGPAYKAGIRPEDVIVRFGERPIRTMFDLRSAVANTPPGASVPVVVVRKGEVKKFEVTLTERTIERQRTSEMETLSFEERQQEERRKEIGLAFQTLTPQIAERIGLAGEQGVWIEEVAVGSIADEAGLEPNFVITHINGDAVRTGQEFKERIESMGSGKGVVIRFIHAVRLQQNQFGPKTVGYTSFLKP